MIINQRLLSRHYFDWRWFLAGCVLLTLLMLTSGAGLSASLQRSGVRIQIIGNPINKHRVVKEKPKPKGQTIIKDDLSGLT